MGRAPEAPASITPFSSGFGALADHDLTKPLTRAQKKDIAAAFHAHLFVVFPRADLTLDQLHDFVLGMGSPDDGKGHLAAGADGYTGIRVVENVEAGRYGPKSNSELHWHADRFFDPVTAGVLNSVIIPPTGGDTSLANMVQALDELPEDLRRMVEGRVIKQDCIIGPDGSHAVRPGDEVVDDVTASPGVEVPIVQTHEKTGQSYLYLGNRLNSYAPGPSVQESERLLDRLFAHADQPRFHYRHSWKPHELILYDNRRCMHRREAFAAECERKLYAAVVVASELI